jgi:hypothetical protein
VALLLVSPDFLASEFVVKEELPRLLAAAKARSRRILPIILKPCLFKRNTLSPFQAINDPARPLSGLSQHEQDLVWERVVNTVLERWTPQLLKVPDPGRKVRHRRQLFSFKVETTHQLPSLFNLLFLLISR